MVKAYGRAPQSVQVLALAQAQVPALGITGVPGPHAPPPCKYLQAAGAPWQEPDFT